jgi:predicted hotdog family 3-hydroxylacyl-ACP dehydratase
MLIAQGQQLDHAQIAALIPHGDSMCLLDEVATWDAEQIHCRSHEFSRNSNPLLDEHDRLATVLLIEYGAQAAAVHAALLQSNLGEKRPAYIGAVKDVEFYATFVDNSLALEIHAQCLLSSSQGAIYELTVGQGTTSLMRGRLVLSQPE